MNGPLRFSAVIAGNLIDVPTAVKGEFAWFDQFFPPPWPEKVQWSIQTWVACWTETLS